MKVKINERLCPTLDSDYDRLYLRNDQTSTAGRKFVALKARKCEPKLDGPCESDAKIGKLLESLIWTYYMAVGTAKLDDQSNYGKNPIVPIDTFFKQFQCNLDSYRDDDINIHINNVRTRDSRFNVFAPYKSY